MLHWLWVIIIGFLAGAIAKIFIHGPGGFIVTTLLGIVGAIVGAVLILAIYRAIVGNAG